MIESPPSREPLTGESGVYGHLIAHLQDAVVEFELEAGDPIVRGVNEAFVDRFGYEAEEITGDPLNEWIVPEWLTEEARSLDRRTAGGDINYRRVKRDTATGLREFLYRGIPCEDPTVRTDGFAVYTDLTDINRKERQLDVLNRVLRHNLRNQVTVISGQMAQLLAELSEQRDEMTPVAASMERAAGRLEQLAEEAAQIDRVLSSSPDGDAAIDCLSMIQRLVREHRAQAPHAFIETNLGDTLEVRANTHLQVALDALIENAIVHNPTASPHVRITAERTDSDGWASIYVEDDGPRIPPSERQVLTGAAEITPTRHGSGLGLWLVKWTVESFGGDLSFEESDLDGNSVHLLLPRA